MDARKLRVWEGWEGKRRGCRTAPPLYLAKQPQHLRKRNKEKHKTKHSRVDLHPLADTRNFVIACSSGFVSIINIARLCMKLPKEPISKIVVTGCERAMFSRLLHARASLSSEDE